MSSSLPRSVIVVDKGGVVSVELPEVVHAAADPHAVTRAACADSCTALVAVAAVPHCVPAKVAGWRRRRIQLARYCCSKCLSPLSEPECRAIDAEGAC